MVIVVDYVILLVCSVAFGDCSSPKACVFANMYFEYTIGASVSTRLYTISTGLDRVHLLYVYHGLVHAFSNRSLRKQFRKFTCPVT